MWPLASFVLGSAWSTLKRFPAPMLAATVAGALLIDVEHRNYRGEAPLLFVLAVGIGIPLGIALTLLAEHPPRWLSRVPARPAWAFVLTAIFVSGYAAFSSRTHEHGDAYLLRYAQLSLAAHLAVSFAPFLARSRTPPDEEARTRGVWQLGRQLFMRLPLSAVYAAVVFGGLALALGAVVHLFGVRVHEDRYFELWVFCAFILQTWHFLAGIPRDFEALGHDHVYPRGLRIFAQFVLLPLLGLYLLILYAYAGKISLSGTLPSGWVGWMVSAAGGFGMLALLLLFPAREGSSGRFVRMVEAGFHMAILPLLGLLFVSLAVRVDAYGITERRYFLLVLGVWLAVASIYRLRWGRRTLAWIPASLCLLSLVTAVGPWGALAVSRESQSDRLTALLHENDRLSGAPPANSPAPFADEREVSRILDYLIGTHGKVSLRRWPGPPGSDGSAQDFMRTRGLRYVERYALNTDSISFHAEQRESLEVRGYDWLLHFALYEHGEPAPPSGRFTLRLSADGSGIDVIDGGVARGSISLVPAIEQVQEGRQHEKGSIEPILLSTESSGLRFMLVLTQLSAERRGERFFVQSSSGNLLIGE